MNSLAGKKAVITGGAGGIGKAIAKRFVEQGASVVLTGRHRANLMKALEELETVKPSSAVAASQAPRHAMHLFNVRKLKGWKDLAESHVSLFVLVVPTRFPQERHMK
jgi:NAD(P)-dependent dehydrogenase (short-subunit alcohol dehydrogenase family)